MLTTPWRRQGPDVYATRLGVVAIFRVSAPYGAKFFAQSYF
jgi:hypothetical protein